MRADADGRAGHMRESLALFVLTAWPAWAVSVPPLQDLPQHLASAFIEAHLGNYPAFVSNGFLKTNVTLYLFLRLVAPLAGYRVAAKLFVTLTCAVGAYAYPRAVRAFGGNVQSASFLLLPFVHSWFVAMGMLDYALSVPLVLLALVELRPPDPPEAGRRGHRARPALAAALGVLVWYTHAFGVVMLGLLVAIEVIASRKWRDVAPLVPAGVLTLWSVVLQLGSETHVSGATRMWQSVPALLYGAWAEWLWSLSKWTIASIAVVPALVWFGARRFREKRAFFSPLAFGALVVLYFALPYQWHHWYFVSSRVLPFAWFACLVRVGELPRWAKGALGACAVAFSAGLGVEYVQNARVWDGVCRGESAVPEGSRLLPMVFDRKGPHGDNTWPMPHVWGLYVIDRGVSAPLVFAHSKSFMLRYAKEPEPRFHGITLEYFPQHHKTRDVYCEENHVAGSAAGGTAQSPSAAGDCARAYDAAWREFWDDAAPRFDRVLMFGVTPDARAEIPKSFRVVFEEGETLILATGGA